MRGAGAAVLAAALTAVPGPAYPAPAAEEAPGRGPVLLLGEAFRFVPGAWAEYEVRDKGEGRDHRLRIATLDRTRKGGRPCAWIEIEAEVPGEPRVLTRLLAEETAEGPGRLLKAVVQVEGLAPFTVPKRWLRGPDPDLGGFRGAGPVRRVEATTVRLPDREVPAWRVEAEDGAGGTLAAVVSEQLPPLGIYLAEDGKVRMALVEQGAGARSRISGPPVPFWVWVLEQAGRAVATDAGP